MPPKIFKMDKAHNYKIWDNNKILLDKYLNEGFLKYTQYNAFYANNTKYNLIFKHLLIVFKKGEKFYFLSLTSNSGNCRIPMHSEDIKEATSLSFQNAKLVEFKSFLNKFYTPVYYELGDENDIVFYNLKELNTLNKEELLEYEKIHTEYKNEFLKCSEKPYINILESLEMIAKFNKNNEE